MRTFLMLMAAVLLTIGASSVWAQDAVTPEGEQLIESTDAIASDAEANFDASVDCADAAMGDEATADGEQPDVNCVSKGDASETDAEPTDDSAEHME